MNRPATKEGGPPSLIEQGTRATAIGIVGMWLLLLYPTLIWSVIGTVSAYGFQDKVRLIRDAQGDPLTISAVLRHATLMDAFEERENKLKIEISEIEELERAYRSKRVWKKEALDIAETEERNLRSEVSDRLLTLEGKGGGVRSPAQKIPDISMAERVQAFGDDPRLSALWPAFLKAGERAERCKEEYLDAVAAQTAAQTGKEGLYQSLSKTQEDIKDLSEGNQIGNIVGELRYMTALGFNRFATMPSQVLTLLLTLFMGALGSLIYITRHYFRDNSEKPFSWYLFRPFLGMVTAFSVFILVKAGQLTVSDMSATQGAGENLNPYFISFFGIVSGLLSEQAIERIRKAGIAVFRTSGTEEAGDDGSETFRWAVGLKSAMAAQGKTAEDLLPFMEQHSLEAMEEWMEEKQPIPSDAQRVISAWLEMPARNLFTDIPPSPPKANEKEDIQETETSESQAAEAENVEEEQEPHRKDAKAQRR